MCLEHTTYNKNHSTLALKVITTMDSQIPTTRDTSVRCAYMYNECGRVPDPPTDFLRANHVTVM